MHKLLLSVILALFMVLAVVGVKKALSPSASANGKTLMAGGSAPQPPIPF